MKKILILSSLFFFLSGMFALAQPPVLNTNPPTGDGHKFYVVDSYSWSISNPGQCPVYPSYSATYILSAGNCESSGGQILCNEIHGSSYNEQTIYCDQITTISQKSAAGSFFLPSLTAYYDMVVEQTTGLLYDVIPNGYSTLYYISFRQPKAYRLGNSNSQLLFCANETIHVESEMSDVALLRSYLAANNVQYQWYEFTYPGNLTAVGPKKTFVANQNPSLDISYGSNITSNDTKQYVLCVYTDENPTSPQFIPSPPITIYPAPPSGTIIQSSTYVGSETVLQNPNLSVNVNHVGCKDGKNGSIEIAPNSGSPSFYYYLTPGIIPQINGTPGEWVLNKETSGGFAFPQNADNISSYSGSYPDLQNGLAAGNYTLIIQNLERGTTPTAGQRLCYSMFYINIKEPATGVGYAATQTNATCFGQSTGSLVITSNGGTAPYAITINGVQNTTDINGKLTLSNLPAGDYTLTAIVDANGCAASIPAGTKYTITQPSSALGISTLEFQASPISSLYSNMCSNSTDGSIRVNAAGGTAPYTFQLTGGSINMNSGSYNNPAIPYGFNSLPVGIYILTVTDANSCTASGSITLTAPPDIQIGQLVSSSCPSANQSIQATATSGYPLAGGEYSYTLLDGGNNALSQVTGVSADFQNLSPGNYKVLVKDQRDLQCSLNTAPINIPFPIVITPTSLQPPSCIGGNDGSLSATVSGGTGPYTYSWAETAQTTASITGLAKGTYTLTVKDANNCSQTTALVLDDPAPLGVTLGSSTMATEPLCFGSSRVLTPSLLNSSGAQTYTYTWTSDKGLNTQASSITVNTEGWYQVDVMSSKGCVASDRITLQYNYLSVNLPTAMNLCQGSILPLDAGYPGSSYTWKDKNGTVVGNAQTLMVSTEGSYSVEVVQPGGCRGNATVQVAYGAMSLHVADDLTNLCKGQSLDVDAGYPGSTYWWHSPNGFDSNRQKITFKDAGVYYLRLVQPDGCTGYDTLEIKKVDYELKSRFTVADYAFVGDTILAVDITYPMPQSVGWELWDEGTGDKVSLKTVNDFMAELKFQKEGKYILKQTVTKLGCNDVSQKRITIYPSKNNPDGSGQAGGGTPDDPLIHTFGIYPNPNTGEFKAKIVLREPKDVAVSLYNDQMGTPVILQQGSGAKEYLFDFKTPGAAKGLYFLILDVGGEQKHLRFIVY